MGRGRTSRPNPHFMPGAERQGLGNNLETAQSLAHPLSGCHCLPCPSRSSPDPRTKAQLTPRPLPPTREAQPNISVTRFPRVFKNEAQSQTSTFRLLSSRGQNGFEVNNQGVLPAQTLLPPGRPVTLAAVRTSSSASRTALREAHSLRVNLQQSSHQVTAYQG